jgi:hypothetical protein
MQCVVHDPARVPDPKNCAFFPKRKQGQVAPIQPRKMVRKSAGIFTYMQVDMTFQYYTKMYLMMALPIGLRNTATPNK